MLVKSFGNDRFRIAKYIFHRRYTASIRLTHLQLINWKSVKCPSLVIAGALDHLNAARADEMSSEFQCKKALIASTGMFPATSSRCFC
jgi:hypothetical protein